MNKLFLFLLVLFAIFYIRKIVSRNAPQSSDHQDRQNASPKAEFETILACARCGVLVPRSEGVEQADKFYCCAEHARLGQQ